jgi:hypothetical protein
MPKLCIRCQFAVPAKSKLCPICGCREFEQLQPITAAATPDLENNSELKLSERIRSVLHDFADDVALTAEKSVSAWQQIQRLIRG